MIATESNVGIDVEKICIDHLNLINFALTEAEIHYLNTKEPSTRKKAFYELWTRKEAYVKAIGTGFSVEPKTISVPFGFEKSIKENYEYYTCTLLDSFMLSVAIKKSSTEEFNYQRYELNFFELFAG